MRIPDPGYKCFLLHQCPEEFDVTIVQFVVKGMEHWQDWGCNYGVSCCIKELMPFVACHDSHHVWPPCMEYGLFVVEHRKNKKFVIHYDYRGGSRVLVTDDNLLERDTTSSVSVLTWVISVCSLRVAVGAEEEVVNYWPDGLTLPLAVSSTVGVVGVPRYGFLSGERFSTPTGVGYGGGDSPTIQQEAPLLSSPIFWDEKLQL
eukprot:10265627-Ditylum_brightwellii.AAC.2